MANECFPLAQLNEETIHKYTGRTSDFLAIINEENYSKFQEAASGGGSIDVFDIVGADASGTWQEFDEKRRKYLSVSGGSATENQVYDRMAKTLPTEDRKLYLECIKAKFVASAKGLQMEVHSEDRKHATVMAAYVPHNLQDTLAPTVVSSQCVNGFVAGSANDNHEFLPQGTKMGEAAVTLTRNPPGSSVTVNLRLSNGEASSLTVNEWKDPVRISVLTDTYIKLKAKHNGVIGALVTDGQTYKFVEGAPGTTLMVEKVFRANTTGVEQETHEPVTDHFDFWLRGLDHDPYLTAGPGTALVPKSAPSTSDGLTKWKFISSSNEVVKDESFYIKDRQDRYIKIENGSLYLTTDRERAALFFVPR